MNNKYVIERSNNINVPKEILVLYPKRNIVKKRNREKERQIFEYLGCKDSDYIFLHEDESRNFLVRRDLIPSNIKIIKPDISLKEFDFFDYTMVIENAKEIHCIESSFTAFIESLPLDVPKFAHRYARPEAKNDFCHEFTYRSSWNIL